MPVRNRQRGGNEFVANLSKLGVPVMKHNTSLVNESLGSIEQARYH